MRHREASQYRVISCVNIVMYVVIMLHLNFGVCCLYLFFLGDKLLFLLIIDRYLILLLVFKCLEVF